MATAAMIRVVAKDGAQIKALASRGGRPDLAGLPVVMGDDCRTAGERAKQFAAAVALWLTRKGTVPRSRWLMRLAVFGILSPFAANAAGWIFTEMGRQPFVVAPNPNPSGVDGVYMFTAAAVSPGVTEGELLFSVITLTLVYAALMVVELAILVRYVRAGVPSAMPELARGEDDDPDDPTRRDVLAFAY